MDYKKSKAPTNTVTHNLMDFAEPTGNIYESIVIMSKRANQIGAKMKEDLSRKLKEFASSTENLEKPLRTANRLKFLATTSACPSRRSSQPTSFCAAMSTSVTR